METNPRCAAPVRKEAPKERQPPLVAPPVHPKPLALFGCTHGELYRAPVAGASAATPSRDDRAAPEPTTTAPLPRSRSYSLLASRMRAMGWRVELLTEFERQLLPPPPATDAATTTAAAASSSSVVVAVLGAPTRRFSRAELEALRAFLLERGGRLWLLAEGADPAGQAPTAGGPNATTSTATTTTTTTNLWRRLCAPLLGVAPRCGEAVVRSAPWPSPPLLVRAAAAALEVAKMQETGDEGELEGEQEEGQRGGGDDEGAAAAAAAVRRAAAALRRVRRAAATSAMCLHPRHALVAMGSAGGEGPSVDAAAPAPSSLDRDGDKGESKAGGGNSGGGAGCILAATVLNRSLARAFADAEDADGDDGDCNDCAFVFADGCPLDVFVGGGAGAGGGGGGSGGAGGAGPAGTATPLLSSGRQCYPSDRPLMAAWEQHQQPQRGKEGAEAAGRPCGGRALVVGSAAAFSDAWLGGSSNGGGNGGGSGNGGGNRCDGNRRLADWCLRWLSSASASCELHPGDGAAARAAVGVASPETKQAGAGADSRGGRRAPPAGRRRYRRPPHALAPAVGALACRVGAVGGEAAAALLPGVVLAPAGAMRGGGCGDWRAMLDAGAFDGAAWRRGREGGDKEEQQQQRASLGTTTAAELAAEMMRPLG